jgi:hypothetical protein
MSPIWRSLEIVGTDALTLTHWQKGIGEDALALLRPYLTPRAERATTVPCARTFRGCGCRYRIVEHDDDTIVGICDEGHCDRRAFTADEIVLYGFNDPKLAAALATALGLQALTSAADTVTTKVLPIATLSGEDGRTTQVLLDRKRPPGVHLGV